MAEKKNLSYLPLSILAAAILIAGAIIYSVGKGNLSSSQNTKSNSPTSVMELTARDPILGDKNAPVTIVEYGDYQCPYCARFANEIEPALKMTYIKNGKVKLIYRELAFLGPESKAAAEAAECAKDQSKFWEFHDLIYQTKLDDYFKNQGSENDGVLNKNLFLKLAGQLGMNQLQFSNCLDSNEYASQVDNVNQSAKNFGIESTPTVFINGQSLVGLYPWQKYQDMIDSILKGAKQ